MIMQDDKETKQRIRNEQHERKKELHEQKKKHININNTTAIRL